MTLGITVTLAFFPVAAIINNEKKACVAVFPSQIIADRHTDFPEWVAALGRRDKAEANG